MPLTQHLFRHSHSHSISYDISTPPDTPRKTKVKAFETTVSTPDKEERKHDRPLEMQQADPSKGNHGTGKGPISYQTYHLESNTSKGHNHGRPPDTECTPKGVRVMQHVVCALVEQITAPVPVTMYEAKGPTYVDITCEPPGTNPKGDTSGQKGFRTDLVQREQLFTMQKSLKATPRKHKVQP